MHVIVCGGRIGKHLSLIWEVLDGLSAMIAFPSNTVICHGDAPGTDKIAGKWAEQRGFKVEKYHIDARLDGDTEKAPKKRNLRMLRESQASMVICFPGGPGTRHMMNIALENPKTQVLDIDFGMPGRFWVWDISVQPAKAIHSQELS